MAFVNITPQVEEVVRKSGVQGGDGARATAMHITASVFINDDERGLHHDFGVWLEQLAPFNPDPNHYHHNRTGEDNADAHLKRQIMGREVVVAITKGKLDFGPWEQIFYGEFDGHRAKRVLVKSHRGVREADCQPPLRESWRSWAATMAMVFHGGTRALPPRRSAGATPTDAQEPGTR